MIERCLEILGPGWSYLQGAKSPVAFVSPTGLIIPLSVIEIVGKKGRRAKKILSLGVFD